MQPLHTLLDPPLSLDRAVSQAVNLIACLDVLHRRGAVHGNINTTTILIDPETFDVNIEGCSALTGSSASGLIQNQPDDPAFMAPEQTGRINRPVDYRADLYGLGVVLYRMLAGQPPFEADSIADWVHSHIARLPRPPHEVRAAMWFCQ